MAEKRAIHEFQTATAAALSALLVDSVDPSATSGYTTEKLILSDLANFVGGGLNYTQQLETTAKSLFGAINELLRYCKNFAPEYDDTVTYEVGEYCIYNGTLYKCVGETTGEFDAEKWVTTYIVDEIGG